MDIERFRELCAAYFLNDLNELESNEFKKALDSGNKELIKVFIDFQRVYLHMPLSVESFVPPARLKENIFKTIVRNTRNTASMFEKFANMFRIQNRRIAFSFVVLLIVGIIGLSYAVIMQSKTISYQKTKIVELTSRLEKNTAILKILKAKQFEVTILNGLSVNPKGYGKIMWDAVRKTAVLQVSNLPPTQPDKDYQLWIIKNNKPLSNGVFSIKWGDDKFFEISDMVESDKSKINAFAVTLEPRGGVPQPTGAMYLLGSTTPNI